MSTDNAIEERVSLTRTRCQHHWIIATPNGVTSRGVCKRCGTERRFPNAADDALQVTANGQGRQSAAARTYFSAKSKASD